MPIRLNLLAEAQAIEEERRRDPVKRAIWIGVILILVVLVWSSSLQLKGMIAKGELSRVTGSVSSRTNEYQQVLANQRKLVEINQRLAALQQLATNRMLHGTLLNALQKTTLDDVYLTRIKVDTAYVLNEETKPKTNSADRVVPGRPASVTEKVVVTLDGKDASVNPGDQVNRFKQALNENPYFQAMMGKTNEVRLTTLSAPQQEEGKPAVRFTLDCRFAEKTR